MEFLLDFYDYSFPILEHYYDSVVNQQLGIVFSKDQSLPNLIDYIKQMIGENQVKDITKNGDFINFTIRGRKYSINRTGVLILYKVKSTDVEVKNLDVLQWIFGNKEEALDSLKTLYSNRIRTINKFEIERLKDLNKKIGKRNPEDFDKTFKSPKKSMREEMKIKVHIDKGISLDIYNKISSRIIF
jgi:glucose-6-phosphate isomerase